MKTAIILGANSYIARNLIFYLKTKDDVKIVGLYDYAEKQIDSEENYTQLDVKSRESVSNINMNCDIIFMFIGKTGTMNGFNDYDVFININEISLLNILNEYRRQKSHAKIIFPSTRLVYKGSDNLLNEDSPKEFKTVYAINKFSCEQYLMQFNNVYDVQYCIFRICVPYGTMIKNASSYGTAEFMMGKGSNGEDISIYGDGSQRRTLTHIKDLCCILYEGAKSGKCINDVYNIGGENYSLKEMAELVANKYKVTVKFIKWPEDAYKIESGSTVFDDAKLKKLINVVEHNFFREWIDLS